MLQLLSLNVVLIVVHVKLIVVVVGVLAFRKPDRLKGVHNPPEIIDILLMSFQQIQTTIIV